MKPLAIYGVGGFAREVAGLAQEQRGAEGHQRAEVVFVDDNPALVGTLVDGLRVFSFQQLAQSNWEVVVAVAEPVLRVRLVRKCEASGLAFGRIIALDAYVDPLAQVGPGSIICSGARVHTSARVGAHVQLNIGAYVAHDCRVGDFTTLGPQAGVNGNTILGQGVYIGAGAMIRQGTPEEPRVIGASALVGMGSVVLENVGPGQRVAGNPARRI